jgi:hypothetical protein
MDQEEETWRTEHSVETHATPQAIWGLFRDVDGWRRWNSGIEDVRLEGPFAEGTWFTMKVPGQDPLRSRLLEVWENSGFVDETRVGDLVVRVMHRISGDGCRTRVTYEVHAEGPGASEVGPMISSDFPEVLAGLVALAEKTS